ncbi:MAG TPA: ATP-binding protein [Candidatus Limnocylindrales bacterium]|nr:ATP-binding protein [Candidatus Limnocylindrales bacterium]
MSQSEERPGPGAAGLRPPTATAQTDGPVIRAILWLAPVAAIVAGLGATIADRTPSAGELLTTVVVPAIVGAFVLLGRTRPLFMRAAAFGLNVEAILAACFASVGLAFAVVLPIVGVGLVQPQLRGRQMIGALVAAGFAAVAGVAAAVVVGPARALFVEMPPLVPVFGFATIVVFGLALQWRANRRLFAALALAEGEITARDRAEAELDRTSEILSALIQSSPVATQAFDMDRNVTIWNPASEKVFGWTAEEVLGAPMPIEMTPAEERAPSRARIERTLGGDVTSGERVRRLTKDGEERWIDIYAAPLRDRRGRPIGVAGQLVDVTERVQLEAQLLQAQKMEAIGLLASGLAHDFNNTLTVAGGYAELIRATAADPQVRSDAAEILAVVERSRTLTRRLLAVGRRSDEAPCPVDIRDTVSDLAPLLRQLLGSPVEVELDLAERPMVARIEASQLEQALINLAVNARDAMPDGGRLSIAVREATVGGADGESMVEIVVRDSGTGIPAEALELIFEPFYTTKPAGEGSGLGLSMVSGFAARAGGDVSVESHPGNGTAFTIRLPEVVGDPVRRLPATEAAPVLRPSTRPLRKIAAMRPAAALFEAQAS